MRAILTAFSAFLLLAAGTSLAQKPDNWSIKTTIIEACSCPMFCQCYFNTEPAGAGGHGGGGHGGEGHGDAAMDHYCRFNNAFRVEKGSYGKTKLDGALFWVAGDLGAEFDDGEMDWAVLTFDPSVTPEQREGIQAILGHVYPVKWKSFTVAADAKMDWTANKDRAEARLDGGKIAEVVLNRGGYGNSADPVVIHNLKYWGVPDNEGFVLMKNEVEAYRAGEKAFEYKGTNGFMITFAMSSKDMSR
jgi:hypothetical protein